MAKVFKDYAKLYDIIYKNKAYAKECEFLSKIFRKYARIPVEDVLDVACGTGNHAVCLSRKGYTVFLQDASRNMLLIAKRKCGREKAKVKSLGCFPMQKFRAKRQVDAIIAMFSSIDYLTDDRDLLRAFKNIRYGIRRGGIFTFDFWNKDCVIKNFTPKKENVYRVGDDKIVRSSATTLDRKRNIAKIKYICRYFRKGKRIDEIEEAHRMKYHSVKDMQRKLRESGFKVLGCFPFMNMGSRISDNDWNISIVATPLT